MALTVGELLAIVRLDKRGYDRGITAAEARMRGFTRDARGRLHDLSGRFVKEGEAAGRGLADGIGRGGERAHRSLLPLAGLLLRGAGLLVFRAALAGAAVNVLGLVAGLAPLLGLVAALPAVLVAAGGALAAFQIGMSGVADAIGGDAEALAGLAPQARRVVTEIRSLDGAWQAVRKTIQGRMFAPLQGQVTELARVWLPLLREQLGGIAQRLGMFGREAATAARDPGFRAGIGSAMAWLYRVLAENRGAVYNLVLGFGALVGAIVPALGLGGGFAEMAARFREWVQSASASGQITGWITSALATLRQLGALLQQVGGILGSVFGAAQQAGGGALGVLTELLTTVNQFLSSGPGNDALLLIFTTLAGVVRALMPAVQVLAGALVKALAPLLPALVPLAGVVAQVVSALAPLLPIVGQVAALVAGLLVQAIGNLLSVLGPVIAALVGALRPVLPLIAAALSQVLAAVAPLASALGQFLGQAIRQLLPPILALIPVLIAGLVPAFDSIVDAGLELLTSMMPMIPLWVDVLEAITPLIPVIVQLAAKILAALLPVLVELIKWTHQIAAKALPLMASAIRAAVPVITAIASALGTFIGWLGKALTAVVKFGQGVTEWFSKLPGRITGFFSDAGSWLLDAGRKIIEGLINGIQGGFDRVKGTLSKLTGMLPDWKGPRERDRRLLQPAGRLIMGGLVSGLRREFPTVRRLLGGLTGELGNLAPAMAGAGGGRWAAPVSNSVSYTANVYPQRVDFTLSDLAQHQHEQAVRARARKPW